MGFCVRRQQAGKSRPTIWFLAAAGALLHGSRVRLLVASPSPSPLPPGERGQSKRPGAWFTFSAVTRGRWRLGHLPSRAMRQYPAPVFPLLSLTHSPTLVHLARSRSPLPSAGEGWLGFCVRRQQAGKSRPTIWFLAADGPLLHGSRVRLPVASPSPYPLPPGERGQSKRPGTPLMLQRHRCQWMCGSPIEEDYRSAFELAVPLANTLPNPCAPRPQSIPSPQRGRGTG